jgi:hypothetical protein
VRKACSFCENASDTVDREQWTVDRGPWTVVPTFERMPAIPWTVELGLCSLVLSASLSCSVGFSQLLCRTQSLNCCVGFNLSTVNCELDEHMP